MKLPLTPEQAKILRNHMWALINMSASYKRVSCQLVRGGSLAVENQAKGWLRLQLRVNRQTAYAIALHKPTVDRLIAEWWSTFGKALIERQPNESA